MAKRIVTPLPSWEVPGDRFSHPLMPASNVPIPGEVPKNGVSADAQINIPVKTVPNSVDPPPF